MKYLVWLIVLFYSCEEKVVNEPLNQIEIDLSQSNPINLDLFCSKIELIPLESTKESTIGEAMYLDYFVSENLLAEDSRRILSNIKPEDNYVIIKYTLRLKQ